MEWISVNDKLPEECTGILGIEMPFEIMYICRREDNHYISDETGDKVILTHWMELHEPPKE